MKGYSEPLEDAIERNVTTTIVGGVEATAYTWPTAFIYEATGGSTAMLWFVSSRTHERECVAGRVVQSKSNDRAEVVSGDDTYSVCGGEHANRSSGEVLRNGRRTGYFRAVLVG